MNFDIGTMLLLSLRLNREDHGTRAVLDATAESIRRASNVIDEAATTGDREWADAVTDDECAVIEDLLGTSTRALQVLVVAASSANRLRTPAGLPRPSDPR